MSQREQVAITSRIFCIAAILGVALVTGEATSIQAVILVAAIGAMAAWVSHLLSTAAFSVLVAESLLVGLVMGLSYPSSLILMPYLVVLPLLAGLLRGLPGVGLVIVAQAVSVLFIPLLANGFVGVGDRVLVLAPWLLTTFGGGLLGVWARSLAVVSATTGADSSYESAHQLLTQLRTVTRRLSAGLDSDSMAAQLLATLHERLGSSYGAVFAKVRGSVLVPLSYQGEGAQQLLMPDDPVVAQCWSEMEPVKGVVAAGSREARHRVALPLRVGNRMIGVALVSGSVPVPQDELVELMPDVEAASMRLDTALVFDEIRTMATADERQRLAREIHDGIAQEVASFGYVLDHLASTTQDLEVAEGLKDVRRELSRVVADLRLSIFDLRSDVSATNGLGSALSDYVRQVGAKSDLTVHLTLDEAPTRLSPAVEAELLRIAQEAVTNARKHASARNLWVDCWTNPPQATLTVRDDGKGLSTGRDDSYGMSIMRERAQRIDASVEVSSPQGPGSQRGTTVHVTVAARSAEPSPSA